MRQKKDNLESYHGVRATLRKNTIVQKVLISNNSAYMCNGHLDILVNFFFIKTNCGIYGRIIWSSLDPS